MRIARGVLLVAAAALAVVAADSEDEDVTTPGNSKGFWPAFVESFGVILATEIGDRTFFIAAIMAMRHPRLIVWAGAAAALVVMTVLSTLVGHVAPLLISRTYTQYAAAGLFLFFGVKMLREGYSIDHSGASEELEEVEAELTKKQVCHCCRPPPVQLPTQHLTTRANSRPRSRCHALPT